MNDHERSDRADAETHTRWLEQADTDPHRINIEGASRAKRTRYMAWHRERLEAAEDTAQLLAQSGYPVCPLLAATIDHHGRWVDTIQATFTTPIPRPRQLTPDQQAAAQAQAVAAYARRHGLSIRQATVILAQQGATR